MSVSCAALPLKKKKILKQCNSSSGFLKGQPKTDSRTVNVDAFMSFRRCKSSKSVAEASCKKKYQARVACGSLFTAVGLL